LFFVRLLRQGQVGVLLAQRPGQFDGFLVMGMGLVVWLIPMRMNVDRHEETISREVDDERSSQVDSHPSVRDEPLITPITRGVTS
jgi:hypothetical protein